MNGIKSKVSVDSSEAEYANSVIRYCVEQKHLLTQPDVMRVDTSQVEGDLGDALLLLQQFQQAQNNLETLVAVGADTSEAEATVNSLAEKIQNQEATYINCGLDIDTTSIDTIQQSISGLTAEAIVTLGVDATAIDGYNPESKTCSVIYDPDTDLLPKSFGPYEATVEYIADLSDLPTHLKTLTRYVNHVAIGDVELNGTAHASGTAKASGDWGTARGGSTLVGELGREIVVDPRTGRWYTVGDNGAEFVNIPAGAIVFNHKQTESLLEYGYVSGRASSLISGTAMVTGGYKPYKPSTGGGNSGTTTTQTNSNNSSATLTVEAELDPTNLEDQLEETLDKMSEEIDEIIGNFEHDIFLLEKNGGSAEEIVEIYRKMQDAVHAQAEKYRDLGLDENSDYIQDLQKQWWDYEDAIKDVKEQVVEDILDMVNATSSAVDDIQNVFDTLKNAADEYAENGGFISVDTFQEIMDLGPQYLQYLRDENGLLVINEESLNRVLAAKTEQLALDNAMAYVERLRLALNNESLEDLNNLLYATTETTNATWGLVYASLALLDLNDDQYQAALHNINAIRALAANAISGIGQVSANTSEHLEEMKQGLDDILQYVMDMLRDRIEEQIEALEEEKEAYADLIELKKESLAATQEETDYQDEVASKIKEIAKLQERISFDFIQLRNKKYSFIKHLDVRDLFIIIV